MQIKFVENVNKWGEESQRRLGRKVLKTSKEIFFETKIEEIRRRYFSARLFLNQIDANICDYWYEPSENKDSNEFAKYSYNSIFLETAIIHYNIVVDLTWVLAYVVAEYAIYAKNNGKPISELISKIEIYDIIRKLENNVTNPTSEVNPFCYISKQDKKFVKIENYLLKFWEVINNTNIRKLYNFIKHKGTPQYCEFSSEIKKNYSVYIEGVEFPTSINDIKMEISLYDTVKELNDFDNKILFPYCDELIKILIPFVYD